MIYLVLPALFAAVLSWLLTPVTMRLAKAYGAMDEPAPRKIHAQAVPRLGGVAVILAAVAAWSIMLTLSWFEGTMPPDLALGMGTGLLPLLAISLLDDIRGVPAIPRLLVQIASASIAVAFGIHLNPNIHLFGATVYIGVLAIPISIAWIVGVTNAFNLADGLDGLSAGLALISALSFSILGLVTGGPTFAALPLVLVGALVGFLPFNLHPARVFLGDVGAATIGFCLACLGLGSGKALTAGVAILVPVLVTGVPILDTLVAIARRMVRRPAGRGARIFQADADHIHHRLIQLGFGHRQAVLLLYGIAAAVSATAVGSIFVTSQNAALLTMTLLAAAFIGVRRLNYDEFAIIRRGGLLKIYDAPVLRTNIFPVFFDIGIVILAMYLAIGLKYDDWRLETHRVLAVNLLALLPATAVIAFSVCHLYRGSWRHASIEDLVRASAAVALATLLAFAVVPVVTGGEVGVSLLMIYGIVLTLAMNIARSSFRLLSYWQHREGAAGDAVIIYGAGAAGALALRELLSNVAHTVQPIGFIDDHPRKRGRFLNGYPILGSLATLERVLVEHNVRGVIVSTDKIPPKSVQQVRSLCSNASVWVKRFQVALVAFEPDRVPRLHSSSTRLRH